MTDILTPEQIAAIAEWFAARDNKSSVAALLKHEAALRARVAELEALVKAWRDAVTEEYDKLWVKYEGLLGKP